MAKEYTIKGSIWYNNHKGLIGIVIVDTGRGEIAKIGIGNGYNKEDDINQVAAVGNSFPLNIAKQLI